MNVSYTPPRECKEIARSILESRDLLLVPHINIDGDDLGSMVAFAQVLKGLGKEAYLYSPDGVPEIFSFMAGTKDLRADLDPQRHFQTALVLECPQKSRLPEGLDLEKRADLIINIDHHPVNNLPCQLSWIDPSFCALGEMLYFVFQEMGVELNRAIAEALYTSIVSDSGSFRYPTTSARTHLVAAHLVSILGDISYIHRALYNNRTPNDLHLQGLVAQTMQTLSGGRLISVDLTRAMLEECQLEEKDTQQLIYQLNVMRGCQIFALFKALDPGTVRVSLRSAQIPINEVAAQFGGGGHACAAACRLAVSSLEEAHQLLWPKLESLLN